MRIAFLISTVHDVGGTAGAVVTQSANLTAAGHDVTILSVFRDGDAHHFPLDPRVTVRDLVDLAEVPDDQRGRAPRLIPRGSDPTLDGLADAALQAALPGLEAHVLVTVTPAMLAYATQLLPPGVAIVHQEHRASANRPHGRELLLDHARRADVVAMLTEGSAVWLRDELGVEAPEVVVVPNALAPGFRPRSPLTEPVIVAAGRLASEKQWPALVSAFALIADRLPEWRLRIFGDGHARFDLTGAARRFGLWDRVELPGPTTDMASEWARASISALVSRSGEGFPLVIQEAMAAGVPVVAYDMATGPRDQITHGVDGLLVEQGSEVGLAAALLRLATDPAERQRMGSAALRTAAGWDAASITRTWEDVYERAVARRRAPVVAPVPPAEAPRPPAPSVTPEEARSALLAVASSVAAGAGDGWFVVPPHGGRDALVVLPMSARDGFLRGLAEAVLPTYAEVHDPEHRGWPGRRGPAADVVPLLLRARTGRLLLEPRTGSHLDRGCAIAVEFWEEGPDGDLHSPGAATFATSVPPVAATVSVTVHGIEVPTLPFLTEPTFDDVTFPIDAVYTWVDGSDETWNAAREARLVAADPVAATRRSSGRARYADRGELRYSLRSLHLYAPWLRHVYLVTAGQTPSWLREHPQVTLVDHRDLLPADALPTFNSQAIETALHRIDGLSEHFLYANDDFFLGAPHHPTDFFTAAGQNRVFLSSHLIGLPGQERLPFEWSAANNRRLLHEAFGRTTLHTLAHAPYAHRRSVLEEIEARFPDELAATARAPFRSPTDVSLLSSLAQHYGLLTGTAIADTADFAFVDLAHPLVRRRFKDLLRRERQGFCLGDAHDFGRDPAAVDALVRDFLQEYLPVPGPWEGAG